MAIDFTARAKLYLNTPDVIARIGKWRNDILARVGAYGQGVFRNKLSRPQLKQTKERTVRIRMILTRPSSKRIWQYDDVVFVPRLGPIVSRTTGKIVPRVVALQALRHVAVQVRHQGAGKPPRMGPSKKLKQYNEFALDPATETVVIGTVPFPTTGPYKTAHVGQILNEGLAGWVANRLLPGGGVVADYGYYSYVDSCLPPTINKLTQLVERRPVA